MENCNLPNIIICMMTEYLYVWVEKGWMEFNARFWWTLKVIMFGFIEYDDEHLTTPRYLYRT